MADKKKGNAFTNNPLVRADWCTENRRRACADCPDSVFQRGKPGFPAVFYTVKYHGLFILPRHSLAIGVTFCLITGGVDLSIGTGMFCYALIGGYLITRQGMPVIVGILATIALGVVMGLYQRM